MANSRTQPPVAARGRFGRSTPVPGSGRSTPGKPRGAAAGRSLRAGQGEVGAKGRFGLGPALSPSGAGRSASAASRGSATGRGAAVGRTTAAGRNVASGRSTRRSVTKRSQPQSQLSGMAKTLTSLVGGKSTAKASSRSRKPAGLALLAGAAGLALKNREKLMGMTRGKSSQDEIASGTVYGGGSASGIQGSTGMPASAVGTTDGHLSGSDTVDQPTTTQLGSD